MITAEKLKEGDRICAEERSYGLIREIKERPPQDPAGEKVMTYTVSFDDCPELRFAYTEKDFPLPWLVVGNVFEMASMHEQYDYNE